MDIKNLTQIVGKLPAEKPKTAQPVKEIHKHHWVENKNGNGLVNCSICGATKHPSQPDP